MSKAVLISIRPKWCEMIANGKKTVEVRKTRPRLEPPFKCYIYCTQQKHPYDDFISFVAEDGVIGFFGGGKVIGEFVCNDIRYADAFNFIVKEDGDKALEGSCIDRAYLFEYLGWEKGKPRAECAPFYRWHISNLKVYDIPKELSEFFGLRQTKFGLEPVSLKRPPQSWCYVESEEK